MRIAAMTSPARQRGRAVAGDEGFHRQHALAAARRQRHRGVERDQAGNGVSDRGRGREIAGDGSEIADLPRADAADERAEGRKVAIEMRQGLGVGDRAADLQRAGVRRDPTQLLDRRERDHGRQRLAILADAQPEIGAACEQDCIGRLRHRREQRVERTRHEKGLRAVAIVRARRQCGERSGQRGRLGGEAIGRSSRDAPARLHDRAVTGAAAEVAGERVMHDRGRPPARRRGGRRTSPSRSPACRSRTGSRRSRPSPAAPDGARRPPPPDPRP